MYANQINEDNCGNLGVKCLKIDLESGFPRFYSIIKFPFERKKKYSLKARPGSIRNAAGISQLDKNINVTVTAANPGRGSSAFIVESYQIKVRRRGSARTRFFKLIKVSIGIVLSLISPHFSPFTKV